MLRITRAVALMLLVVAAGCTTTEPELVDEASANNQEPNQAAPQVFAMGQTTRFGDIEVTLNGARFETGDQYYGPEAGTNWLMLDLSFVNHGSEPFTVSSILGFSLVDEDGFNKDITFTGEENGSLDGTIGPGRTIRGEISFEVGESQQRWELVIEPDVLDLGQIIYEIDRSQVVA